MSTVPKCKSLAERRTAWDGIQYSFPEFFTQYGTDAQEIWSNLDENGESLNCLQEALNFRGTNRVSQRPVGEGSSLLDAAAALGATTQECKKLAFHKLRDLHPNASYAILGTAGKRKFHACSNLRDKPECFEYHAFVIHVGLTLWYAPSNSGPCGVKLNTLYRLRRNEWNMECNYSVGSCRTRGCITGRRKP